MADPQQTRLFDSVLTPQTRKHLLENCPGVFCHVLLELMPVGALSQHLNSLLGWPSKESYSIAGLISLIIIPPTPNSISVQGSGMLTH